jgi:hypothetical protein
MNTFDLADIKEFLQDFALSLGLKYNSEELANDFLNSFGYGKEEDLSNPAFQKFSLEDVQEFLLDFVDMYDLPAYIKEVQDFVQGLGYKKENLGTRLEERYLEDVYSNVTQNGGTKEEAIAAVQEELGNLGLSEIDQTALMNSITNKYAAAYNEDHQFFAVPGKAEVIPEMEERRNNIIRDVYKDLINEGYSPEEAKEQIKKEFDISHDMFEPFKEVPYGQGKQPEKWKPIEGEEVDEAEDVAGNQIRPGDYVDLIGDFTGSSHLEDPEDTKKDPVEYGVVKKLVLKEDPEVKWSLLPDAIEELKNEGYKPQQAEEIAKSEWDLDVPWAIVELLDSDGNPTGKFKTVVHYNLSKSSSEETKEQRLHRIASHIQILFNRIEASNLNHYNRVAKSLEKDKKKNELFKKTYNEEDLAGKYNKKVEKENKMDTKKAFELKKALDDMLMDFFDDEGYSEDEEISKLDEIYNTAKQLVEMHETMDYSEDEELALVREVFETAKDVLGLHGERVASENQEIRLAKIKKLDQLLKIVANQNISSLITQIEDMEFSEEQETRVFNVNYFPQGTKQVDEKGFLLALNNSGKKSGEYDYSIEFPVPGGSDGLFIYILDDGSVIFDHTMYSGTAFKTPPGVGEEGLSSMLQEMINNVKQ